MLVFAFLLAQAASQAAAATPTPVSTARPAPALGRASEPARAKTLAEHAAEMKTKGTRPKSVSFADVRTVDPADAAELPVASGPDRPRAAGAGAADGKATDGAAAATAQRRMDRAVQKGLAVPERTSTSRRDRARREWDDAAEACRRTPGCVPQYRDDVRYGEDKPLKTDYELIDDIRKRGFSEPHPLPK